MWQQAIDFHRTVYPDDFGVMVKDEHYYPKLADLMIERRRRKIHSYLDIEPLTSSLMVSSALPTIVRGQRLMFRDASGAFRVRLSKDDVVHILRCRLNAKVSVEYAIGTKQGMLQLHSLCHAGTKKLRRSLPKKGVWDAGVSDHEPYFLKVPLAEVREAAHFESHPMFGALASDFNQFFGDIAYYTRYGQSGMRKVLLAGPPGTGKTTIAQALAAKYQDRFVFVRADDRSFREVCIEAAKRRVPTVVIAEEVDELYRADAHTLSFLDGIKSPRNPAGTYVLFSTNYPKRIDPRILKRPGRIDKVLPIGAFRRKAAAVCARMYLPEGCTITDKDLGAVFDRTTAAEIKEIVVIALGITRSTKRDLDAEVLSMARQHLVGALKYSMNVCDEDMESRADDFEELGPEADLSEYET